MPKTKRQIVQEEIAIIKEQYSENRLFVQKGASREYSVDNLYVKERWDYGFHVYFVSPILNSDSEKLHELYYNLRERSYYFKTDFKERKFSPEIIKQVIPHDMAESFYKIVETENNQGMYKHLAQALGKLKAEMVHMAGRFLYRLITEYPHLELLYKTGLFRRVTAFRRNYEGPMKPHEICDVKKSTLKILRHADSRKLVDLDSMDMGFQIMRLQSIESWSEDYNVNAYSAVQGYNSLVQYTEGLLEEFGGVNINSYSYPRNHSNAESALKFVRERCGHFMDYLDYKYSDDEEGNNPKHYLFDLCMRWGMDIRRAIRYFAFEVRMSQGLTCQDAMETYVDYRTMISQEGLPLNNKYPDSLVRDHDVLAMNIKEVQDAETQEAFHNIVTDPGYAFINKEEAGKHVLLSPEHTSDMTVEGSSLGHCVGGYINNVVNGNTKIYFLRDKKKPEESKVTVEVHGQKVVQARGKYNRALTEKEREDLNTICRRNKLTSFTLPDQTNKRILKEREEQEERELVEV